MAFLGAFTAIWGVQALVLTRAARDEVTAWASTNLDNLEVDPVGTMVASAFVAEDAQGVLLVAAALGLFPVARRFGNARALGLAAAAHMLGTVVSQGIALVRLEAGDLPDSIRTAPDVGPSYVVCGALVAAALYGPGGARRLPPLAGWLTLGPVLLRGLPTLQVAAVGHLVAMLTGALVGGVFALRGRRLAVPPAETAGVVRDAAGAARSEN
ncbi:rhomboid-like protein [Actinomadura roseirufa]|uniref:rhomboid-like protein n=1 Tax=Actinomadura roseirufa TaxID=2094049 RepID=UPI001040F821|nr:rhomboid-like protein [Actinomadura roseirufa]